MNLRVRLHDESKASPEVRQALAFVCAELQRLGGKPPQVFALTRGEKAVGMAWVREGVDAAGPILDVGIELMPEETT